ncbi:MAG: hypothetical protein HKL96_03355 [Phycisphaerales bacterium]|nr:hypothetical protein [Phycisphaerales bacterium]
MEQPIDKRAINPVPEPVGIQIPAGFRLIPGLKATLMARQSGYLRDERFVIAAFHPEAHAVIWKDGHESGFGDGGPAFYFRTVLPQTRLLQADLTDETHIGDDVLVLDLLEDKIYIAPRLCAEEFLARVIGTHLPHHRCLCARPLEAAANGGTCPARQERPPASTIGEHPEGNGSSSPDRL